MRAAAHIRDAPGSESAFPRWAIDGGLRPVDGPVATFTGTLPCSGARFSVSRVGETTTVRAAAPEAAGLTEPVYAWWDPVYAELACGARRVEHSDIAHAFLTDDLRRVLADPLLVTGTAEGEEPPVVAWTSGQVIVQWSGPADEPGVLVDAADAALVAVRVARLDRLIDLDLEEDLPCPTHGDEDEARADGALATVFVTVAALAGGLVLAAGAGIVGAVLVAALVVAVGAVVTVQDHGLRPEASAMGGPEFVADLYAGYHGLQREESSAFQTRFWALGVACAPAVVLRGVIPGTTFTGRMLWGVGPGGCAAAAVAVVVPDGMMETVSRRAERLHGASMAGGCLLVLAADDAQPGGLELVEEVTRRAAVVLT